MRLSLCIATFNEEKNLHYALDSTASWVDEIVIVDGGSSDKTLEIARSHGSKVKIIQTSNPTIFHINKQKAIEEATGEWILQLDADEEITSELKHEILALVSNPPEKYLAYQIPRRNYFLGRFLMKGGVYPDYTTRLYRRGTMFFPCKDVHENVVPIENRNHPDPAVAGEGSHAWLGTLKHPMNHYSDPTFGRYLARWVRYCKIEASRMQPKIEEVRTKKSAASFALFRVKMVLNFIVIQPPFWFVKTYIRHKGFMDGWQGFVFHFMSALRWLGIAHFLLRS